MSYFYTHGKLLLSAEYAVLDGALALALPTRLGQSLEVNPGKELLHWQSFDADNSCWFEATLEYPSFEVISSTDEKVAARLIQILGAAKNLNPDFDPFGKVITRLEFSRHWGLGTSSTLIANIASWAGVNPFELLEATFGGSGYDIACADAEGPVWFRRMDGQPETIPISFRPPFSSSIYFAYLGQKQDSREGIQRYRARSADLPARWLQDISAISLKMAESKELSEFEALMKAHEELISSALDLPTVQETLFPDFWGVVKSLGAWGGDFVLLSSRQESAETISYLEKKGITTVFSWNELIL